ncbi:hypothetical protein H0X10_01300 [Candidatus Saccharibacteria bacterium]|nr:hypothetical protein [Candidatus Saccharibacteria bacterium]
MNKQALLKNIHHKIFGSISLALLILIAVPQPAAAIPSDPPAGSSLQQRIDFRKNELKLVVDPKDEQRLKTRCIAIQALYRNFQQELSPKVTNHQNKYQSIDAKLYLAIGKLKLAQRDTLELEKQRTALAAKVAALDIVFTNYSQSIDDVVVMNCQADLIGFKSLVQTSRGYHDAVRLQTSDIKNYVVDTIKATLAGHTTALQPK